MDPLTAVGGGLAVLGSKEILTKLLGPTADYIGGKTKGLVEKMDINIDNIFKSAVNKLGDRIDSPGQVNPRVLKCVLDEGRFCEDPITQDYFGGILASSKSQDPLDDRGAAIADSIRGLSAYQLKAHYIIYHLFRQQLLGDELFINSKVTRKRVCLFIPSPEYYFMIAPNLDYKQYEQEIKTISAHVLHGIKRYFLIDDTTVKTTQKKLKERLPHDFKEEITSNGCLFHPTPQGAELFLWAHGYPDKSPKLMFSDDLDISRPIINLPKANAFLLPRNSDETQKGEA